MPERYVIPIAYEVGKACTPKRPQACGPSSKDKAMFNKETSFITRLYQRQGEHSARPSPFQL